MSYAIDFKQLKADYAIADVAAKMLGASLTPQGEGDKLQLRGVCPVHGGKDPRAFTINPAKRSFFCFSPDCNSGGDVIELVARAKGWDGKDRARLAAEAIVAHFKEGATANAPPQEKPATGRKSEGFDPLEYQKALQPDHPALTPLGVSADTIRHFGGGFCSKGLLIGRLALPLHNLKGGITGFFGVGLPAPHELKFAKEYPDLFGVPLITDGPLNLVPHPLSVLRSFEAGMDNVVANLRPLNWATLTSLAELMKARNCTELELY